MASEVGDFLSELTEDNFGFEELQFWDGCVWSRNISGV